jgi:transcription initiation factor TFIID TATA-box-binding protein
MSRRPTAAPKPTARRSRPGNQSDVDFTDHEPTISTTTNRATTIPDLIESRVSNKNIQTQMESRGDEMDDLNFIDKNKRQKLKKVSSQDGLIGLDSINIGTHDTDTKHTQSNNNNNNNNNQKTSSTLIGLRNENSKRKTNFSPIDHDLPAHSSATTSSTTTTTTQTTTTTSTTTMTTTTQSAQNDNDNQNDNFDQFDFNSRVNLGSLINLGTNQPSNDIDQLNEFDPTDENLIEIKSHFTADFSALETSPLATLENNIHSHNLVQIQNMVGVVNLNCPIDLREIAMSAKNAEYNPRRFISVVIRLRDPRTTVLLFRSGKIVIAGARTEHQTRLGARKVARLIQKLGHPNVTFNDFTISNMVGAADVRFPINLYQFAHDHSQYAEFEPEIFPALIYRMQNLPVVLLIFVNGKVIITGGKHRSDLYTAFEHIYSLLCVYRKQSLFSASNNEEKGPILVPNAHLTPNASLNTSIGANTTQLGDWSNVFDPQVDAGDAGDD